ncbi:hypothetical protein FNV43_RR23481 [Rhamnella rubrinervis]|uniref:PRA1 family protein n=1 Tax=Rhamnella rubrinervis TaxID=2594499 RepID=A0A8K0GS42_9ROSA|nr:hypothetical protein FNV43_RR23481 [Rhamnella rubrinervis]
MARGHQTHLVVQPPQDLGLRHETYQVFRANYTVVVHFTFFLSVLLHRQAIFFFTLFMLVLFIFYFFDEDDPLQFEAWNHPIDVRLLLEVLLTLPALAVLYGGLWLNVLVSFSVSFRLLGLHATFRAATEASLSLSRFLKFSGYVPSSIMAAYGSIPTASTFSGVDEGRDHVYFTRLRQLRELMTPISSFSRPSTFDEAIARMKHNLSYFRSTYAMFVLLIIGLSCLLHPDLMIFFVIVYSVWLLLYFCHDDPFVVFNRTVDDRIVLGVLGVFTVIFLLPSGAWPNVLVSILIGFKIVVTHATFRGKEDLPSDLQCDDVQRFSALGFPGQI